jgi:hypothetical protein
VRDLGLHDKERGYRPGVARHFTKPLDSTMFSEEMSARMARGGSTKRRLLSAGQPRWRNRVGDVPVQRLNARVKLLTSVKPSKKVISVTETPGWRR